MPKSQQEIAKDHDDPTSAPPSPLIFPFLIRPKQGCVGGRFLADVIWILFDPLKKQNKTKQQKTNNTETSFLQNLLF